MAPLRIAVVATFAIAALAASTACSQGKGSEGSANPGTTACEVFPDHTCVDYWYRAVIVDPGPPEVCFVESGSDVAHCGRIPVSNELGKLTVGDCVEFLYAYPSLQAYNLRRASGCLPTAVTAPPPGSRPTR